MNEMNEVTVSGEVDLIQMLVEANKKADAAKEEKEQLKEKLRAKALMELESFRAAEASDKAEYIKLIDDISDSYEMKRNAILERYAEYGILLADSTIDGFTSESSINDHIGSMTNSERVAIREKMKRFLIEAKLNGQTVIVADFNKHFGVDRMKGKGLCRPFEHFIKRDGHGRLATMEWIGQM
jgi:hypothetical protein